MNEIQEIRFDKETSEKLDCLVECFQLVLEQIHVKNNTDIHAARQQIREEVIEEKKEEIFHDCRDELLPLLIKELVEKMKSEGIEVNRHGILQSAPMENN